MAKTTPKVQHNQLHLPGHQTPLCTVDSPAWFAWLESATSFRYHSQQRRLIIRHYGPLLAPISLRKEKRRRRFLWYAYKRAYGRLHKRYVGLSAALTTTKLDQVALWLNQL